LFAALSPTAVGAERAECVPTTYRIHHPPTPIGTQLRNYRAQPGRAAGSAPDIPIDATIACLKRTKSSHRGIGDRKQLKILFAFAANQGFLEEISDLEALEELYLRWPVTATDLGPLRRLRRLRMLTIDSPRNVHDFTPLLDLPDLRHLMIENAKHLTGLEFLTAADRLEVIGVEGSMWTTQKIESLRPLAGLRSLQGLFLSNTRVADKSLAPLADCPQLKAMSCARWIAPQAEFERLKRLKPELECQWFDPTMWEKDWLERRTERVDW